MTTRERHLAFGLLGTVGVLGLGFVAYQFVVGPLLEKGRQIRQRESEVAQLEMQILDIQLQKRKFEAARQQSLPADVGLSRTQYGNLLERLFRRADMMAGLKITPSEPDSKSVPMLAPKKPAYTRLTYEVVAKGELYHLVDFLQRFYQQPLLHEVKKMNIQRPSDARSQRSRELDINLTIEALVLDDAQARPTLLPVLRETALLSGAAAQTAYNMEAATSGRGSPVPPADVLAEPAREYLAIPGKDVFHGPLPTLTKGPRKDDDHSQFITLTSIVGYEDGSMVAVFRDKLDNHNYTVTQSAKGAIEVKGEYDLRGEWKPAPGYRKEKNGRELFYGTEEGQNRQVWLVRRVTLGEVILEKVDDWGGQEKSKPTGLAFVGGGPGAILAVPEGKMYSVSVLQTLHIDSRDEKFPPPKKFLLTKDAWKAIYAPTTAASPLGNEVRAER